MYFNTKNYLKNTHNHTDKHAQSLFTWSGLLAQIMGIIHPF